MRPTPVYKRIFSCEIRMPIFFTDFVEIFMDMYLEGGIEHSSRNEKHWIHEFRNGPFRLYAKVMSGD